MIYFEEIRIFADSNALPKVAPHRICDIAFVRTIL